MILISLFWSTLGVRLLQQLIEQILREGFFARKERKITQENGSVHDRIESAGNLFLDRELKKVFTLPLLPFLGISLIWPKAALISSIEFFSAWTSKKTFSFNSPLNRVIWILRNKLINKTLILNFCQRWESISKCKIICWFSLAPREIYGAFLPR